MTDTFDRDESQGLPDLINGTTNQKRAELRRYLINHEGHSPRNAAPTRLETISARQDPPHPTAS